MPGLISIEEKLRDAQLQNSLDGLHCTLCVKSRMIQFKNKNICGQRGGIYVEKYRAARSAKLALAGSGDWKKSYRVLNNADVRGYQDPDRLCIQVGR